MVFESVPEFIGFSNLVHKIQQWDRTYQTNSVTQKVQRHFLLGRQYRRGDI